LYLRALAKYRQGLNEDALSDLETIHNNMNDIYNADIVQKSDKDTVLTSYLYYLKSQILKSTGAGVKADLQKAMTNKVLADILSSQKDITLSAADFDSQYDYLRETFTDKDLNITYLNPNYKISLSEKPVAAINTEPVKNINSENEAQEIESTADNISQTQEIAAQKINPEPSLASMDFSANAAKSREIVSDNISAGENKLKQSTLPAQTLPQGDEPSIAQLLATQSLPTENSVKSTETAAEKNCSGS